VSIVHHDLCFGCGQANLLGLQLELEPVEKGVAGRFFVKQDHQGPTGAAHGGVVAAALEEAMALAVEAEEIPAAVTARLELELERTVPVGTFLQLEARIDRRRDRELDVSAAASGEGGEPVARATATLRIRS
jgi:acyl-coenzyme A thioesterase PaaI-like protein